MRRQSSYSRRQFFRVGAAGVATTMVVASGPGRGVARAAVQSPPPMNTAPRVLRKPPLDELGRIAKSYGLDASAEDLASRPYDFAMGPSSPSGGLRNTHRAAVQIGRADARTPVTS